MKTNTVATKKQAWKPWNGFAVEIKPDTELSGAMLIAEYESGAYEPISPVISVNEAREIATDDAKHRRARGGDPVAYKLWARGIEGRYMTVPVAICNEYDALYIARLNARRTGATR